MLYGHVGSAPITSSSRIKSRIRRIVSLFNLDARFRARAPCTGNARSTNRGKCTYGFGEVVTLVSVFSSFVVVLLPPGGFTTVVLVSFFSDGGFTIVVLLSFFSAGGLTVVVFCSHAANKPNIANR